MHYVKSGAMMAVIVILVVAAGNRVAALRKIMGTD